MSFKASIPFLFIILAFGAFAKPSLSHKMDHARQATVSIFVQSNATSSPDKMTFGTGFLISAEGHIVTSAHNVKGNNTVTIQLLDQPEQPAKIIGVDPLTDIAVLKITTPKPLPYLEWNTNPVYLGQKIFIIGTPFGLSGTVSAGIVSTPHRALTNSDIGLNPANQVSGFIQTDAAMSLGHSGGPMLNEKGEVIGINTAIVSPTEGSAGLGFATPARLAEFIARELIKYGRIQRLALGIELQNLTPALADYLNVANGQGAIIAGIDEQGSGYKHGLRVGDVVLAINHEPVSSADSMPELLTLNALGSEIILDIQRDKQTQTLSIPITPALLRKTRKPQAQASYDQQLLSLQVKDITDLDRVKNDLPKSMSGCLVTNVPTHLEKEIFVGSILSKVNETPITNAEQAIGLLQQARSSSKPSLLHLWFEGKHYVALYS
ncbi:MAG: hypothetical protein CMM87_01765 [Rickettsiales bacterium]|nr:hypothetical protein [Rickettsiales bacterium]|tara:strand:+ start:14381 stop:15685 length:1305 start_codon:yes stop_codon:yes gene_type:complete